MRFSIKPNIGAALSATRKSGRTSRGGGSLEDPVGWDDEEDSLNHLSGEGQKVNHGGMVEKYDPAAPGSEDSYDDLAETREDPSGPRDDLIEEPHGNLFMDTDFFDFEASPMRDSQEDAPDPEVMKRRRRMFVGGRY